jgi:hypothetical protein
VARTEVFVGGSVAAAGAAVMVGLGVAALAPSMLPHDALAALSAAFRSVVRG